MHKEALLLTLVAVIILMMVGCFLFHKDYKPSAKDSVD